MSTETTEAPEYDPFDAPAQEAPADTDGIDWNSVGEGDEFDDILDGLDLAEEESGEAIQVRDSGKKYDDPAEVGLLDQMWVPIRILTSAVEDKHLPRLNSKTCIARKDGKTFVLFDAVESALRNGAEEIIRDDIRLPYFVCTANHAAPQFGQRRWDWEIEVPVFTIKTALFKEQKNRTGYKNETGRSLRLATGATSAGDTVSKDNMHEVAGKMVETMVMAQISMSKPKKKPVDVLDEKGNRINVLLDQETRDPVLVFKLEDETGYVVEGSGEVWEDNEGLLVPVEGRLFAIRDEGDFSGPLRVEKSQCTDYLKATFLPMPDRNIQVEMLDGEVAEGEITLDTIGVIARSKEPGFKVDVLIRTGKKTGDTITAVWLGTEWDEVSAKSSEGENFSGDNEKQGIESL